MTRLPTTKARLVAFFLITFTAVPLSSALVAPRSRAVAGGPARAAQPSKVVFAAVGDFGDDHENGPVVAAVAELIKKKLDPKPEFVITLGDNNYYCGSRETIKANITDHYGNFIKSGKDNNFFPALGNHDWGHVQSSNTPNASGGCKDPPGTACPNPQNPLDRIKPYLDLFDLPAANGERYYDFVRGPVHFFALDSDCNEPDGITPDSKQAEWLRAALEKSTARYKIVYLHHPPYTSGYYVSQKDLQWDFRKWGATLVMSGHEHSYERLYVDCLPYIVNGSGGRELRGFEEAKKLSSSLVRLGKKKPEDIKSGKEKDAIPNYGAMRITADEQKMVLEFFRSDGKRLDYCSIRGAGGGDIGKQCWEP